MFWQIVFWFVVANKPAASPQANIFDKDSIKSTYRLPDVNVSAKPGFTATGEVRLKQTDILNTPSIILPDPLRVIALLPFVEVESELSPANMYIKGGRPEENAVFIEGFPCIVPYHFGFSTIIPISAISYYDFYTLDLPPEFSGVMTSAINFHLKQTPSKELYLDPTSSISYVNADRKMLGSFRLTSVSLPVMFLTHWKYIQYFADFFVRKEFNSKKSVLFLFTRDYYLDKVVEMVLYDNLSSLVGVRLSPGLKVYLTGSWYKNANRPDDTREDMIVAKKVILGSILKNNILSDKFSLTLKAEFVNPGISGDEEINPADHVNLSPYLSLHCYPELKFRGNQLKVSTGFDSYIDRSHKWFVFTPKFSYTVLRFRDSLVFKISSGITSQIESRLPLSPIFVRFKSAKPMRSFYVQAELRGEHTGIGVFARYYPDLFFLREDVRPTLDPIDSMVMMEIFDTLVNAKEKAWGIYLSFLKNFYHDRIRLWLDVSFMNAEMMESNDIVYPLPYLSKLSGKLFLSYDITEKLRFNLSFIAKSNVLEPSFFTNSQWDIIKFSRPVVRSLGGYMRLDIGITRNLEILHRQALISAGIYNLIYKKPKIESFYQKQYVRTPLPYLGIKIWL